MELRPCRESMEGRKERPTFQRQGEENSTKETEVEKRRFRRGVVSLREAKGGRCSLPASSATEKEGD